MELVIKKSVLVGGYGTIPQTRNTKVVVDDKNEAKELVRQGFAEEYDKAKHKNVKDGLRQAFDATPRVSGVVATEADEGDAKVAGGQGKKQ